MTGTQDLPGGVPRSPAWLLGAAMAIALPAAAALLARDWRLLLTAPAGVGFGCLLVAALGVQRPDISRRWLLTRGAGVLLMVAACLSLAGCEEGGISLTQAGLRMPTRSLGSDLASSGICRRFDPITGNLVEEVIVSRDSNPNAAFVAALENIANTGLSKIPNPAVAAMMAAKPDERAAMMARAHQEQLDIAHCIGLANPNVKMPLPPDPTPPQTGQTPDDAEHGSLMPLPPAQHTRSEPLGR